MLDIVYETTTVRRSPTLDCTGTAATLEWNGGAKIYLEALWFGPVDKHTQLEFIGVLRHDKTARFRRENTGWRFGGDDGWRGTLDSIRDLLLWWSSTFVNHLLVRGRFHKGHDLRYYHRWRVRSDASTDMGALLSTLPLVIQTYS